MYNSFMYVRALPRYEPLTIEPFGGWFSLVSSSRYSSQTALCSSLLNPSEDMQSLTDHQKAETMNEPNVFPGSARGGGGVKVVDRKNVLNLK